jgi:NAD(P) transhydrogenase subunit beta
MPTSLQTIGYLVAGVLFILSLSGLSRQETARRGNWSGIIGMAIALAVTLLGQDQELALGLVIGAVAIGAVIGAVAAARVAMTGMPELVAILHSFVGAAAVLVGLATFEASTSHDIIHMIEIYLAVSVGAVTFTGSVIAWAKLRGSLSGSPLLLPGRHGLNAGVLVALVVLAGFFCQPEALISGDGAVLAGWSAHEAGRWILIANTVIACLLGVHLVMAIGGADMPVVVSLLNSYSGWAAAAAGFMLSNDLLIITGALVGSSGAILSYIMCVGMNRSIWNVVFGGFGTSDAKPASSGETRTKDDCNSTNASEVAELLKGARKVAIVPGYGMAVAKAQHTVSQLTKELRGNGSEVTFGIHPVAGRLPGHMNVLLAEADVPYDIVHEMDEMNPDLPETDIALIIGANDIVNPDALVDASSPIFGMPQIEVWNARQVVVFKRSLSPGYAGVANPLFFNDNTLMLFGDAQASVDDILKSLR